MDLRPNMKENNKNKEKQRGCMQKKSGNPKWGAWV